VHPSIRSSCCSTASACPRKPSAFPARSTQGPTRSASKRRASCQSATSSATAAPPAPTHEQPPPPPPKTSPLVLGGFIGGGALVGLGAIFGIVSAAKVSDIKKDCLGSSCFPNRKSDGDSASTFANLSNISIALGAIGVGVGIYGLMSSPSSAPAAAARRGVDVHVGAGTVAVSGSF
jgi:hypothetical protein